jgi:hypothetical protein
MHRCQYTNLQIPFFERLLFLDARPSNCTSSRADKALTRFLIRSPKQGIVLQLVGTGRAAGQGLEARVCVGCGWRGAGLRAQQGCTRPLLRY